MEHLKPLVHAGMGLVLAAATMAPHTSSPSQHLVTQTIVVMNAGPAVAARDQQIVRPLVASVRSPLVVWSSRSPITPGQTRALAAARDVIYIGTPSGDLSRGWRNALRGIRGSIVDFGGNPEWFGAPRSWGFSSTGELVREVRIEGRLWPTTAPETVSPLRDLASGHAAVLTSISSGGRFSPAIVSLPSSGHRHRIIATVLVTQGVLALAEQRALLTMYAQKNARPTQVVVAVGIVTPSTGAYNLLLLARMLHGRHIPYTVLVDPLSPNATAYSKANAQFPVLVRVLRTVTHHLGGAVILVVAPPPPLRYDAWGDEWVPHIPQGAWTQKAEKKAIMESLRVLIHNRIVPIGGTIAKESGRSGPALLEQYFSTIMTPGQTFVAALPTGTRAPSGSVLRIPTPSVWSGALSPTGGMAVDAAIEEQSLVAGTTVTFLVAPQVNLPELQTTLTVLQATTPRARRWMNLRTVTFETRSPWAIITGQQGRITWHILQPSFFHTPSRFPTLVQRMGGLGAWFIAIAVSGVLLFLVTRTLVLRRQRPRRLFREDPQRGGKSVK